MDKYSLWNKTWKKVESMLPEERIRWEMENQCTCGFLPLDEYIIADGHYKSCPLHNLNNEMWIFWEGADEGFVIPNSKGE